MYAAYAEHYDASQLRFSILMHSYLSELLAQLRGEAPAGHMVDLACGTGTLALLMAEQGWDVLGIDLAPEMLRMAQRKARRFQGPGSVRLRRADMRELTVERPADLITCFYDSLNYLLTAEELGQVFARVAAALAPGGLWIFDLNTPFFLEHVWSPVEVEERSGYLQAMQSHFDAERCVSTLVLTGFVAGPDGLYQRFDEVHAERGYSEATVAALLAAAGLRQLAVYDAFTSSPPHPESHRLVWVATTERSGQ